MGSVAVGDADDEQKRKGDEHDPPVGLRKEPRQHSHCTDGNHEDNSHQSRVFGYSENDDRQVLELPYADYDLSMIVLLPRKTDGLANLEATLTAQNLDAWTGKLSRQKVEVFLPKFNVTSQFSLKDSLAALGMTDAFDGKADCGTVGLLVGKGGYFVVLGLLTLTGGLTSRSIYDRVYNATFQRRKTGSE